MSTEQKNNTKLDTKLDTILDTKLDTKLDIQPPPYIVNNLQLKKKLKRQRYRAKCKAKRREQQQTHNTINNNNVQERYMKYLQTLKSKRQRKVLQPQQKTHEPQQGQVNVKKMFEECGVTDTKTQTQIIQAIQNKEIKTIKDLSKFMKLYT